MRILLHRRGQSAHLRRRGGQASPRRRGRPRRMGLSSWLPFHLWRPCPRIGGWVKFGVGLAQVHRSQWLDMTRLCEELGFESVWFPDHLVFTEAMSGSPYTGDDHPPVPPTTP